MPTSESAVEILWEGTAQTVRAATDACKDEQQSAARAHGMETILRVALSLLDIAERILTFTWDDLFSERIRDVETTGDRLERCATTTLDIAKAARELVGRAEAEGHQFEHLPALLAGMARLSEMKERLAGHWPRFDPVQLEKGLAQASRGEFVDMEEIYREFPELQDKGGS